MHEVALHEYLYPELFVSIIMWHLSHVISVSAFLLVISDSYLVHLSVCMRLTQASDSVTMLKALFVSEHILCYCHSHTLTVCGQHASLTKVMTKIAL